MKREIGKGPGKRKVWFRFEVSRGYSDKIMAVTNLDAITSLVFDNLNSSLAKTQGSLYVHTGKRLIRY